MMKMARMQQEKYNSDDVHEGLRRIPQAAVLPECIFAPMETELNALNAQISETRAAIFRRKKMQSRLRNVNQDQAKREREVAYLS